MGHGRTSHSVWIQAWYAPHKTDLQLGGDNLGENMVALVYMALGVTSLMA